MLSPGIRAEESEAWTLALHAFGLIMHFAGSNSQASKINSRSAVCAACRFRRSAVSALAAFGLPGRFRPAACVAPAGFLAGLWAGVDGLQIVLVAWEMVSPAIMSYRLLLLALAVWTPLKDSLLTFTILILMWIFVR